MFCHKCFEVMASIEVIDAETKQYISYPKIEIVCHSNNKIRNRIVDRDFMGDSTHIRIEGKPGKYSFYIRKEGFKEIKIENIKIKHFGYFRCNQPKTEHLLLKMYKIDEKTENEDQDNIIKRYQEGCCN
jgi:hypothetical protein